MSRREFPKAVKVAVIKRAARDGVTYCEGCGALAKRWQIDHVRPDGLLGEPTIENAQLLGECCYAPKNASDTTIIAKAKRVEARHIGAKRPTGTLKSRGFSKYARDPKPPLETAHGATEIARRFATAMED